jgi:hypothetical protein
MQQPQVREVTVYADIGEVRTETRVAVCNQLLKPQSSLNQPANHPLPRGHDWTPAQVQAFLHELANAHCLTFR